MKSEYVSAVRVPLAIAFVSVAFSAQAADLYDHGAGMKDAPYYDAVPNWTGFYLGVNGGYGWAARSSALSASAIENLTAESASSRLWTEGGFGGGQLGYNVQRDRFVFGIEADIQGSGISGKAETIPFSGNVTTDAWAKSSLDWFGTVRGRAGYAVGGTLLYATGGFAYGGVRDRLNQLVTSTNPVTPAAVYDTASSNATATGYVVGGGFETAITPSWSFKAEYQYLDLSSTLLSTATANTDIPYPCGGNGPCSDNGTAVAKFDHTYHTVRIGLNYKVNQSYEPLK